MDSLPLQFLNGHVFVELDGEFWLLDTGAPKSFGTSRSLIIAGKEVKVERTSYLGLPDLTAATLSQFVGVPSCAGLLGADVLNLFDHIFDSAGAKLTVSTAELSHGGQTTVPLDEIKGIPIVKARVNGSDYYYRMFFDTGAQISYFQNKRVIAAFPSAGTVTDFYPGFGQFPTDTHWVPVLLDGVAFKLRCGTLLSRLDMTLTDLFRMASTEGIIGNEILCNRIVGYFPRRRMMVL
jgi:hypothetical protein